MSYLQQIDSPPAANAEVQVNENFDSIEHSAVYGNDPATTTGLVRGYIGGNWGSFTTIASTHTFGGSTTTYVAVNRSTGALDFSTSSTNFDDSSGYATVEVVVSGTSTISSVSNRRGGPGGVHGQVDTSGTGDFSSDTSTSVDGEVVVFSGTGGKTGKRATGSGLAKLTSGVLGVASASDVASYAATVTALATSGTVDIDCSLGDYFTCALAGNVTSITFSNLPGSGNGASKWIQFTQDSTPRTVAWPASFKWAGGSAGAVSTGSGAVDELAITTVDNGTTWKATLGNAFA